MKCLILGGNRFIGKKLADKLVKHGCSVTVLNRTGNGPTGCNVIKCDRNDINLIENDYDVIVDFCLFKPDQANPLRSFLKPSQRYLFISSAAAYKDSHCQFYTETMEVGGREKFGDYGKDKAKCEAIVDSFDVSSIIVRPPYIVGNDCPRPRLRFYIEKLLNDGKCPVAGNGNALFSLVWSEDVVNVLFTMVTDSRAFRQKHYNISSYDVYSSRTLVAELSEFLNRPYEIIEEVKDVPFLNENLILSTERLNWRFVPIKYRLKEFCEYSSINYETVIKS